MGRRRSMTQPSDRTIYKMSRDELENTYKRQIQLAKSRQFNLAHSPYGKSKKLSEFLEGASFGIPSDLDKLRDAVFEGKKALKSRTGSVSGQQQIDVTGLKEMVLFSKKYNAYVDDIQEAMDYVTAKKLRGLGGTYVLTFDYEDKERGISIHERVGVFNREEGRKFWELIDKAKSRFHFSSLKEGSDGVIGTIYDWFTENPNISVDEIEDRLEAMKSAEEEQEAAALAAAQREAAKKTGFKGKVYK